MRLEVRMERQTPENSLAVLVDGYVERKTGHHDDASSEENASLGADQRTQDAGRRRPLAHQTSFDAKPLADPVEPRNRSAEEPADDELDPSEQRDAILGRLNETNAAPQACTDDLGDEHPEPELPAVVKSSGTLAKLRPV
jgi:hypothetical protein